MSAHHLARTGFVVFLALLCVGCVPYSDGIDDTMSLEDAKEHAQQVEREIASAVPVELLSDVDQRDKGSFLACSRDGGHQWAGGLTATVVSDPAPEEVLNPIALHFADRDDLAVGRREDHGDSLLDLMGPHGAMWIVRYVRDRGELDVDSFATCIRLPEGVWPGGSY
ncbi:MULTISPECIES: hypothetical protein [Microbacterium]|uniref:hypothetical protein n=1 Tax=Microbacterium TaxID=33882 RepID=UPI00277D8859|nr:MULTISPECIES: hypothetical protein [Microbacterium]MDQ1076541.1 hypothetical protein [Microbacterium sp. SORGH_AS_0969]MDQ1116776.1 hypothetical protein [Microbacterium testaceum]